MTDELMEQRMAELNARNMVQVRNDANYLERKIAKIHYSTVICV